MRILVTGASGQLGQAMVRRVPGAADRTGAGPGFSQPLHEVVAQSRRELDISSWRDVATAVRAIQPDAIVNCAAYNDVNAAEHEPVTALATNAWGPKHLARAAEEAGAIFVHFSTDFVFDGETERPYAETDAPNPRGRYASSKLLGEWFALEMPRAYVLRVESLFGGPRAKSSVDMLLRALVSGTPARPFSDRVVSPSYVEDVAGATVALLGRQPAFGLYHCVNSGMVTWLGLTQELAGLSGRPEAPIAPMRMRDAKLDPPRPRFAALSNAKLTQAGIPMPPWRDALARYVASRTS